MRVAVTEGREHLAVPLVRALIERGHEVVRLTRRAGADRGPLTDRPWDPDAGRIFGPGLDDVDAAVNLHSVTVTRRWTPKVREEVRAARITSTLTVVSALDPDGRCQRLLNLSSTAYYGDSMAESLTIGAPAGRDWLARAAADWEGAARHSPVPTTLLRTPPAILSRTGGYLAERAGWLAGRLGSGRQNLPWIHVADWAAAVIFLLTTPVEGPVNVVAPQAVSEATFVAERARAAGRRPGPAVPDWWLDARFGRDAADALWRASTAAHPCILLEEGFTHRFGRLSEALEDVIGG